MAQVSVVFEEPNVDERSAQGSPIARAARRTSEVTLFALIVGAPLAIGVVHTPVRVVVFVLCALLLALRLVHARTHERGFPISVPLIALCVATAATAIQLVPLPSGLLRTLSPHTHEILSATLGDYRAHAISLDPSSTWMELAKIAAYGAFLAGATAYCSRTHRRHRILIAVAAVSTVVALIGLVQFAAGIDRVAFIYEPHGAGERAVRGTFVNPNHFGALLCLGAPCVVALGLREPRWRVAAVGACVVINVAAILSFSRTAIVAVPLAQVMTYVLYRWQSRRRSASRRAPIGGQVALAVALAGSVLFAGAQESRRLAHEAELTEVGELSSPLEGDRSKFTLWKDATNLMWSYPWTGTGRGAFGPAFTQVNRRAGDYEYSYVENGYLQALTDWGAPVGLILLALGMTSLFVTFRRLPEDPLRCGAVAAIIALAIHEAADFAVELPGVALPALALLATIFGPHGPNAGPGVRWAGTRTWALVAPLIVLVLAFSQLTVNTARADTAHLTRLVRDSSVSVETVTSAGVALRARHPADCIVHALVAERQARARAPEAINWLNDAIYLCPRHPTLHLLAAELLLRYGRRGQARIEYRLALEYTSSPEPIWQRIVSEYRDAEDLLAAVPSSAHELDAFGNWLVATKRPVLAVAVYVRVLENDPFHERALIQLANLHLAAKEWDQAQHYIERLKQLDGNKLGWRRLAVREMMGRDQLDTASELLDGAEDRSDEAFSLELEVARIFSLRGQSDVARSRLKKLSWQRTPRLVQRLHETRAEVERRAGNENLYEYEMQQAKRAVPR